jgi:hypothetical protein
MTRLTSQRPQPARATPRAAISSSEGPLPDAGIDTPQAITPLAVTVAQTGPMQPLPARYGLLAPQSPTLIPRAGSPAPPELIDEPGTAGTLTPGELLCWMMEEGLRPRDRLERNVLVYNILMQSSCGHRLFGLDELYHLDVATLPQELSIQGDLHVDAGHLTSLPANLRLEGSLNLHGCLSLTSLPTGLSVGGRLILFRCTGIRSLPTNLNVGALHLSYCTGLTTLPADLRVAGDLHLYSCSNLSSLPDDLTIRGDLDLTYCTGLTLLPENLSSEGFLSLTGCTGLTSLPANLRVGGHLYLNDCTGLTALPDAYLGWGPRPDGTVRLIDLSGTSLSPSLRERLALHPNRALQFPYNEVLYPRRREPFETLTQALGELEELHHGPSLLAWPQNQQAILCRYLCRLVDTADYGNVKVRPALLARLNAVLSLACTDEDFRAHALEVFDDAVQTCGDRVILGLNTVELELGIKQASNQSGVERAAALKRFGLSLMKLSIVHAHAAESCKQMQLVDEVEVYLAYEVMLRQRLGLPGQTISMLYGSGVHAEEFEAAAQEAERQSASPLAVDAFFSAWTPWQQHLRQTEAESLTYVQIARHQALLPAEADGPRVCAITQETEDALVRPVYLGSPGNARVYDYDSLIAWWVEHGKEPAPYGAFSLNQLWLASDKHVRTTLEDASGVNKRLAQP